MVNASLNWASIVGIVLVLFALSLLFLSNQKPKLAGGYDSILSISCLLCGFILFFQGWRLDPILQFSQLLLSSIVIFLGYQSLKLRRALVNVNKAENKVSRTTSNRDGIRGQVKCSYCGAPVN